MVCKGVWKLAFRVWEVVPIEISMTMIAANLSISITVSSRICSSCPVPCISKPYNLKALRDRGPNKQLFSDAIRKITQALIVLRAFH